MWRSLLTSLLFVVSAWTQGGPASHIISGPNRPARCSPLSGDIWFNTGSGPVGTLYICSSPNTWTLLGTSGISYPAGTGLVTVAAGAWGVTVDPSTFAPATSGSVPLKGNGLGGFANSLYTDITGLWTTCSGYLKSDGTCDT